MLILFSWKQGGVKELVERKDCKCQFSAQYYKQKTHPKDYVSRQCKPMHIGIKKNQSSLSSKIIRDGDCSHEIKSHLLFGRKAVTNLNKILIFKDIVPTKIHILCSGNNMAMKFWIIKKTELKNGCHELWCWRSLFKIP